MGVYYNAANVDLCEVLDPDRWTDKNPRIMAELARRAWGANARFVVSPDEGDTGLYFAGNRFGFRRVVPVEQPGPNCHASVACPAECACGCVLCASRRAPERPPCRDCGEPTLGGPECATCAEMRMEGE